MNKSLTYLLVGVGGAAGSYIPVWAFGVSAFSILSILGGVAGGILGIVAAYKIGVN